MVQKRYSDKGFFALRLQRLFRSLEVSVTTLPILPVQIDRGRLVAKRSITPNTIDTELLYLLKPKIQRLLDAKKHPAYRLILDLTWTTSARVFAVLTPKPTSFAGDSYDYGVILKALKPRPCQPIQKALQCSLKPYIAMTDHTLSDRIQNYFITGISRKPSEFSNVPAGGESVIRVRVGGHCRGPTVDGVHF
ncbi:hypothetical protein [Pseudoteredinibacter isoporae]|uniref:hypothetical protein n=1 Tax=Pseudoteredinibacter isoporae TaxID=570281 RepID=UPI0033420C04